MALAVELGLCIEEGAALQKNLLWKDKNGTPIPLTGYTARLRASQFKDDVAVASSTFIDITETLNSQGQVRLEPSGVGTIEIFLLGSFTEGLVITQFESGTVDDVRYDLELTPGSPNSERIRRLTQGPVVFSEHNHEDIP